MPAGRPWSRWWSSAGAAPGPGARRCGVQRQRWNIGVVRAAAMFHRCGQATGPRTSADGHPAPSRTTRTTLTTRTCLARLRPGPGPGPTDPMAPLGRIGPPQWAIGSLLARLRPSAELSAGRAASPRSARPPAPPRATRPVLAPGLPEQLITGRVRAGRVRRTRNRRTRTRNRRTRNRRARWPAARCAGLGRLGGGEVLGVRPGHVPGPHRGAGRYLHRRHEVILSPDRAVGQPGTGRAKWSPCGGTTRARRSGGIATSCCCGAGRRSARWARPSPSSRCR